MTLPVGWVLAPPIGIDQAAAYAYRAGFRGEGGAIMLAVAVAESGLVPNNRNLNSDDRHTTDRGILQINSYWHREVSDAEADDPAKAFEQGYRISAGGTAFGQWFTYSHGDYKRHLESARAAMRRVQALAGDGHPLPADISLDYPVRGDIVAGAIPASLATAPAPPLTVSAIRVRGQRWELLPFTGRVIGAPLELSVDEASQLTLRIADPAGAGAYLTVGTKFDLGDLRFEVTSVDHGPSGGALEEMTVVAMAAGVEALRMADPVGVPKVWQNTTVSQVLEREAVDAKLRFIGEGGPVYPTLTRLGQADTSQYSTATTTSGESPDRAESDWEFADRMARIEGKWRFEAAGTLYYARPSWLVSKLTRFTVRWRWPVGAGHFTPLEAPTLSVAVDDTRPGRPAGPHSISVLLPRGLADRIRPGMVMLYSGTFGWETKPFGKFFESPVGYLVTSVSIDLLDPGAGVKVQAREAVDPKPVPEDGAAIDPSVTTTTPAIPRSIEISSALDMVTFALAQVGDRYQFGAEADPKDTDPDVFDCSELIQWACAQVGVTFVDGSSNQIAAIAAAGLEIPVATAASLRGALLWAPGHCGISLGDGTHTVEARGRKYGVVVGPITRGRFTRAGRIPGLSYGTGVVSRSTPPLR